MKTRSINVKKKQQRRLRYNSLEKESDFSLCRDYAEKIEIFKSQMAIIFWKKNVLKA